MKNSLPATGARARGKASKAVLESQREPSWAARGSRNSRTSHTSHTSPRLQNSRLAELAGVIVASRRRNLQAVAEGGRKSYAGVEAVLKRRLEILRQTLSELRLVAKVMRRAGVRESVAHLDDLARGTLQLTLNSVRELVSLAASSQRDALEILARRLQDDLAEFKRLRSARKPSRSTRK